jgi:hypothetical protein
MPFSSNTEMRVVPALPFLVVMRMTPFAASVPYSVAADGPLRTSMVSISDGSMSSKRESPLERPVAASVFSWMPST